MDPEIERAGRGGECGEVREMMKDEDGKEERRNMKDEERGVRECVIDV